MLRRTFVPAIVLGSILRNHTDLMCEAVETETSEFSKQVELDMDKVFLHVNK
jgi:hypothetical protein